MSQSINRKVVVIFGGSGFVGNHLIPKLQEDGYSVHIADIVPTKNNNVTFHLCDVRNEIDIELNEQPDLIINLAAVHRTPGHESDDYFVSNVAGATNIVNWATQKNVNDIVFTSSIAVYGPGEDLKDESSPLTPIHAYGKSKLLAENIFLTWQNENSNRRRILICRPAVIFGAGEKGNYSRMARALKLGLFLIPGSRNLVKSSGYVGDLTRSIVFMIKSAKTSETYNFCFPSLLTIGEISSAMASIAEWRKPFALPLRRFVPVLTRLGYPLSHIGKRIEKLLLPTRIEAAVLKRMGFVWEYDLQASLNEWYEYSKFDTEVKLEA